jgi:hypothetical protein
MGARGCGIAAEKEPEGMADHLQAQLKKCGPNQLCARDFYFPKRA